MPIMVNNFNKLPRFRYDDIRSKSNIFDGDMFFCVGRSKVSKGIIECTDSKFVIINGEKITPSHIGYFDWHRNQLMCLEAESEVKLSRFSHCYTNIKDSGRKYNGRIFLARHELQGQVERAMNKMAEKVGLDYDHDAILRQLQNKIKIFGELKNIPNNKWFCSELGNYGFDYMYGGQYEYVTPVDIATHKTTKFICEIIF